MVHILEDVYLMLGTLGCVVQIFLTGRQDNVNRMSKMFLHVPMVDLKFPNAAVLNAGGRRNTQINAKERKRAQKERKRVQKSAKGRKTA